MQSGILIKDGSDIKAKHVYSGDVSEETMESFKAAFELKYPTLTVTIYASDENSEFKDAVVNSPFPAE